jgi:hypothetical protein
MASKIDRRITTEDLHVLDCLEKREIRQVPFKLMDKLIAAGLIEVAMVPPDRISARGSALLAELRNAAEKPATAGGLAARDDNPTARLRLDAGARRRA